MDQKYIFPGGHIPAVSDVIPAIEKSGLAITDVEFLWSHYARTLRLWRERFLANREQAYSLTTQVQSAQPLGTERQERR